MRYVNQWRNETPGWSDELNGRIFSAECPKCSHRVFYGVCGMPRQCESCGAINFRCIEDSVRMGAENEKAIH